jgi:hypothetical protein
VGTLARSGLNLAIFLALEKRNRKLDARISQRRIGSVYDKLSGIYSFPIWRNSSPSVTNSLSLTEGPCVDLQSRAREFLIVMLIRWSIFLAEDLCALNSPGEGS